MLISQSSVIFRDQTTKNRKKIVIVNCNCKNRKIVIVRSVNIEIYNKYLSRQDAKQASRFNAFTPGVHFGEDEPSHSPPITCSGRLHYTMKSSFFSPLLRRWTAIYARPRTGNLFLGKFNRPSSSPSIVCEFSSDFRDPPLREPPLTTWMECRQAWNVENQAARWIFIFVAF